MKKLIKKLINRLGIDIKRLHPEYRNSLSFDDIYNLKIKDNPVIFDVGANQGQSIERFRKIFPKSIIHSFEPIKKEFEMLRNKYNNDENIKINNHAIGDEVGKKKFYITALTGTSSFNKVNKNIVNFVELEIMFDNVYEKYLTFSDIEKYLLPNQFRFSAIRTYNENLFQGLVFFADVMYINTKNIKINSNN